eukprot:TRINITY_DN63971_c0_g1_i4.p1 TRINITY_DN63971_c0_g1~~TRINITY_DN63971_c0_g1_i4.p1  ORF type:complete len:237 (+),score=32.65 TRINITY_DN63971_c0_g1_i4:146-856(+)
MPDETAVPIVKALGCKPLYFVGGFAVATWYTFLLVSGPSNDLPPPAVTTAPTAPDTQTAVAQTRAPQIVAAYPPAALQQQAATQTAAPHDSQPGSLAEKKVFNQYAADGSEDLFKRLKPKPGGRPTRFVYLDMGSNWANTLRLHMDIMPLEYQNEAWEVYSFEPNPYIAPYVNKYTNWLNGKGNKPAILVPPAGSFGHLAQFAQHWNCQRSDVREMGICMYNVFRRRIDALQVTIC